MEIRGLLGGGGDMVREIGSDISEGGGRLVVIGRM